MPRVRLVRRLLALALLGLLGPALLTSAHDTPALPLHTATPAPGTPAATPTQGTPSTGAPGTGPFLPGTAVTAQTCTQDGYLAWVDDTGTPFRTAAACTSYAARGGRLFPRSLLAVVFARVGQLFYETVTGAGLQPGATITWTATDVTGRTSASTFNRTVSTVGVVAIVDNFGWSCGAFRAVVIQTRDRAGNSIAATAPLPC